MTNSTNMLVYAVSALMLTAGGIYLHEAYLESQEFSTEFTAQVETMFFTISGILYVPFGIWMINNKLASKVLQAGIIAICAILLVRSKKKSSYQNRTLNH